MKLVILAILTFSFTVFADEKSKEEIFHSQKSLLSPNGDILHIIKYFEENSYFVDVYRVSPGKLQVLESRQRLNLESETNKIFDSLFTSLPNVKGRLPFNPSETELLNSRIWTTREQWSVEWENRYSNWVQNEIDAQRYLYNNNIASDCADVAIAHRWIFARMNGLPAGQQLAGSGALFSNESMKSSWRYLSTANDWQNDQLFLAALNYVLDNTYTHSLMHDSYPIEINTAAFKPGIHHLALTRTTGHTLHVQEVDTQNSRIITVASTVPRQVRTLYRSTYRRFSQPKKDKSGFLRMRWPVRVNNRLQLRPAHQMPFYSEIQYDPNFAPIGRAFYSEVLSRLNASSDPIVELTRVLDEMTKKFSDRVDIVDEGFDFCSTSNCAPGTMNYEIWSTPSRDGRILDFIDIVRAVYSEASPDPRANSIWTQYMENKIELKVDPAPVLKRLDSLISIWDAETFSSDPRDSKKDRWGL